jgi:hypothetical protein
MNEERTELLFRQREHIGCHLWHIYSVICGTYIQSFVAHIFSHLWHIYSVTVNQVMVAIVKHSAIIIITNLGIVVKVVVEQAYKWSNYFTIMIGYCLTSM